MSSQSQPIAKRPPITGYLVVPKLDDAVQFYSKVFGAQENQRYKDESGKVWFAEMTLLGNRLQLMEAMPDMELVPRQQSHLAAAGGDSNMLSLDVDDVDGVFERAIAAGATPIIAPYNAHWGDRYAEFRDPFLQRVAACTANTSATPAQKEEWFNEWREEHGNLKSPASVVKVGSQN
ncbi:MAG TPA: VOC family protein [Terriglobales bacterium]|nr:VOC family protein [Terriglobales bacterium]